MHAERDRSRPAKLLIAMARATRQPGQAIGVVAAAMGVLSAIVTKAAR
jgi:hypothetical protein